MEKDPFPRDPTFPKLSDVFDRMSHSVYAAEKKSPAEAGLFFEACDWIPDHCPRGRPG